MERRTKHDLRSAATRQRLVAAARRLFAERGYAGVGTEEIVQAAGVTRGALYHQFRDKVELFAAVVEEVEGEVMTRIAQRVAAAVQGGPVEALLAGARAFLEECAEPEVERIILLDAPAVLGAAAWRELGERHALDLVRQLLLAAVEIGAIPEQPVTPLARLLLGALDDAAIYVAGADDPAAAREEYLAAFAWLVGRWLPAAECVPGARGSGDLTSGRGGVNG